jgi:hypothetical protein
LRCDLRRDFRAADLRCDLRRDFRRDFRADDLRRDLRCDLRRDFRAADFRFDLRCDLLLSSLTHLTDFPDNSAIQSFPSFPTITRPSQSVAE